MREQKQSENAAVIKGVIILSGEELSGTTGFYIGPFDTQELLDKTAHAFMEQLIANQGDKWRLTEQGKHQSLSDIFICGATLRRGKPNECSIEVHNVRVCNLEEPRTISSIKDILKQIPDLTATKCVAP